MAGWDNDYLLKIIAVIKTRLPCGEHLGLVANLAAVFQSQAKSHTLLLYGKVCEVMVYDQVALLKILR